MKLIFRYKIYNNSLYNGCRIGSRRDSILGNSRGITFSRIGLRGFITSTSFSLSRTIRFCSKNFSKLAFSLHIKNETSFS